MASIRMSHETMYFFLGGGQSSRKESMTRYESDWKTVNDYLLELQQEQYMIVASKNVPNYLFEHMDWNKVDEMQQKMVRLS